MKDEKSPERAALDAIIDELTAEAESDDARIWNFHQAFQKHISLPCDGFVIGEPVKLVSFNYDGNQRRGVTTTCRRSDGREYEVAASEVLVQSIRTVRDISARTAIGWAWCPMPSMKKLHDAHQSPESARDRSLWRIR